MKTYLPFCLLVCVLAASCGDKDLDFDATELNNGVTACEYAPYTTGSTFLYEYQDFFGDWEEVTWTVGEPVELNGTDYIGISAFFGLSSNLGYFNCEDGVYTVYADYVPAINTSYELTYLKEGVPVGTTWEERIDVTQSGFTTKNRYEFSFVGTAASRTVNGVAYNDIIHIHLDTYTSADFVPEFLYSQDDYYWARGVGFVEAVGNSVNYRLISYNIN